MTAVCLVGVSGYAGTHYKNLLELHRRKAIELKAVAIINQQEEQEKVRHLRELNIKIYTDYRKMFSEVGSPCDLACIPTGIHQHFPMSMEALAAGMNVLVEKPLCATVQDALALQKTAEQAGKFVAVGYQSAYLPAVLELKKMLVSGALGRLETIRCHCQSARNNAYYARNQWAGQLKVGDRWVLDSPFNNAYAHQVNLLCFLAGSQVNQAARIAQVQAELYRCHEFPGADTACIRWNTPEDVTLAFYVTHCCRKSVEPVILLQTDQARVTWDSTNPLQDIVINRHDGSQQTIVNLREDSEPGFVLNMFYKVVQRIADPEVFVETADIAASQTMVANGAHESSPVNPLPAGFYSPEQPAARETEPRNAADLDYLAIQDIDVLFARACQSGKLMSELGVPWARPGRSVDMRDYSFFPSADRIQESNKETS